MNKKNVSKILTSGTWDVLFNKTSAQIDSIIKGAIHGVVIDEKSK